MPDLLVILVVALTLIVVSINEPTPPEIFRIMGLTLIAILAFVLVLAFAINVNGWYYAYRDHPSFVLAERSLAYRDLLALQIEDIALIADLSDEMPVYYDYFGFYRLEYSELGYSDQPLPSGVSVFHYRELAEATLADLPRRFASSSSIRPWAARFF